VVHKLVLLGLVLFTLTACGEIDQSAKDSADRWSSAKCPPTEVCGPQSSPESLVRAWLEASENGLCSVLAKYSSSDRSEIVPDYCGTKDSYKIVAIEIKETAGEIQDRPNLKEAVILGDLSFSRNGESITRNEWSLLIEDIGGKWYVFDGYH